TVPAQSAKSAVLKPAVKAATLSYRPERSRSSRRCPPMEITADSALISSHLIKILLPPASLISPSSPGSKVRPLIMAVRLGGLVMPLRTNKVVSTGFSLLSLVGTTTRTVDCGKKGLRPSLGWLGTLKMDWGKGTSGTDGMFSLTRLAGFSLLLARPRSGETTPHTANT